MISDVALTYALLGQKFLYDEVNGFRQCKGVEVCLDLFRRKYLESCEWYVHLFFGENFVHASNEFCLVLSYLINLFMLSFDVSNV
jgi:hypothetical protein